MENSKLGPFYENVLDVHSIYVRVLLHKLRYSSIQLSQIYLDPELETTCTLNVSLCVIAPSSTYMRMTIPRGKEGKKDAERGKQLRCNGTYTIYLYVNVRYVNVTIRYTRTYIRTRHEYRQ